MKKTLSMFLVLALTLAMTAVAFALDGNARITGMSQSLTLGFSNSGNTIDLGEVYPQDERVEYIPLYDTMFTWDNAQPDFGAPAQLTAAQIRAARLDVRFGGQTGKVIDSITLNQNKSRIEVKFMPEYVGTKEIDFEIDVFLTIDGRRQNEHGMTFIGTFGNQVVDLYSGYGSVDISDGCVARATESISKLEVDIGNGITIITRLSKDKRIYGVSTRTPDEKDESVMKEHREISDVLTLRTVGLDSSGNVVKLGAEFHNVHVYNKDLEYLGKGSDNLPYSGKYYLTAKKLTIPEKNAENESGSNSSTAIETEPSTPASTTQTSPNVNNNPNTGR